MLQKSALTAGIGVMVALIILFSVAIPVMNDVISNSTTTISVSGETFTAAEGNISLAHGNIVSNSETVYNATVTILPSGNYTMYYDEGIISITDIANTSFANGSTYSIDYQYTTPTFSGTVLNIANLSVLMLVLGAVVIAYAWFRDWL